LIHFIVIDVGVVLFVAVLVMSMFSIPDVHTMYSTLFPGGEFVGEAISILRDSYSFLSKHVDATEGGRAIVLAVFSMLLTIALLVQRRAGNKQTLFFTCLGALAIHGSMVTVFGLPWFVYPAVDHLLRNSHFSALITFLSVTSIVLGWGSDCIPSMSGFRQRMTGRWSFSEVPDAPWGWALFFFGLVFSCISAMVYRCILVC
jgi:hypothetical protein